MPHDNWSHENCTCPPPELEPFDTSDYWDAFFGPGAGGIEYTDLTQFTEVKDSGKRQEFDTGSVRDSRDGKGRFDLLPPEFLRRLARHCENGARKYGDRNWEKGQPLSRFLDSAMRHIVCILAGDSDEDHEAAAAWNIMAFITTKERIARGVLPRELNDLG